MAFFSDGKSEYFSLITNPASADFPYIFELNEKQSSVSRRMAPFLAFAGAVIFIISIVFAVIQIVGVSRGIFEGPVSERIIIGISMLAALCAFSEIAFFIWVKKSKRSVSDFFASNKLSTLRPIKRRSLFSYVAFLLCMFVPFVGMLGLPGDTFNNHTNSSIGLNIFFFQLLLALLFVAFLLIKKILNLIND